ncbi:MAG: hypothetical protein ACKPKO_16560, partial [Candidatus Fonsibacter sp.]
HSGRVQRLSGARQVLSANAFGSQRLVREFGEATKVHTAQYPSGADVQSSGLGLSGRFGQRRVQVHRGPTRSGIYTPEVCDADFDTEIAREAVEAVEESAEALGVFAFERPRLQ